MNPTNPNNARPVTDRGGRFAFYFVTPHIMDKPKALAFGGLLLPASLHSHYHPEERRRAEGLLDLNPLPVFVDGSHGGGSTGGLPPVA